MTVNVSDTVVPEWHSPGVLHVIAEDHESLQDGLDQAVLHIRNAASPIDVRGILITRRSRTLFTVEASTDVPYGTTLEKDRWHRRLAAASSAAAGDEAGL